MAVVDLVTARQVDQFLGEKGLLIRRDDEVIDKDKVDEWGSHGTGIAEVIYLNGRGPERHDFSAGMACVALEIDKDINCIGSNLLRRLLEGGVPDVPEAVESLHQPLPHRAAIIGAVGISKDVKTPAIMFFD